MQAAKPADSGQAATSGASQRMAAISEAEGREEEADTPTKAPRRAAAATSSPSGSGAFLSLPRLKNGFHQDLSADVLQLWTVFAGSCAGSSIRASDLGSMLGTISRAVIIGVASAVLYFVMQIRVHRLPDCRPWRRPFEIEINFLLCWLIVTV